MFAQKPPAPRRRRVRLRDLPTSTQGVAAIEFALVAPLLVLLLVGTVELGLAVRDADRAQQAAATGAAYAVAHGWDPLAIGNAVTSGSGAQGISASPAPVLYCGCPQAGGVAPTACGVACADGANARQYARVSASLTRTSLFSSSLTLPATITRQSIARLQ